MIGQREKQLSETKEEYDGERLMLTQKYDELKERYDTTEEELNSKKIEFEKDQALNQQ